MVNYETIVDLIANTRNAQGLKVAAKLDRRNYPLKEKISDAEFQALNICRDEFHGDWNYSILPTPIDSEVS